MKLKNVFGVLFSMFFVGCYTQLATINYAPPPEMVTTEVDSVTGDTVKIVRQVDTIVTEQNKICVWERDFTGYPVLKCYSTYFPRAWVTYGNTPWWYRNDPYWYDYNHCPRYYYYDVSCGCCRYIDNYRYPYGGKHNKPHLGGGSGGNPVPYSSSSSRSKGVPRYGSPVIPSTGTAVTPLSKVPEIKPQNQDARKVVRTGRATGIPAPGTARPVENLNKTSSVPSNIAPPVQPPVQEQKQNESGRRGRSSGVPNPQSVK